MNNMRNPRIIDVNLDMMIRTSLLHIIALGTKHGVFSFLTKNPTPQELIDEIDLPNRRLLLSFINVLKRLNIIEERDYALYLDGFSYTIKIPQGKYDLVVPDWVSVQEEIYRMVDYAFITPVHPHVLMDFDKDADFWDMRMNTKFSRAYRDVTASLLGIKKGMSVLDIGCGSVSPAYFGEKVGYNGFYMGVDYSPALLDIARARVEAKNLPVELKELDARLIRPVNEYDAVILSFVLEYVEPKDRGRVLKNALDVLKSGGRMAIVDPFIDSFEFVPALEFFESLNKEFRGFPAAKEITERILALGFDVEIERPARSVLLVRKL
ncbi:class I SAM-dependent methyltransferase [Thermococcus sp. 21S7]|uniref:class I SAM-dependent methyltransferase n=1 Tax=Thermococcus sp. 21S7 TaxID=1638221 RepID=UPI00143B9B3F|nr:class I SAM-dependent methyltransferase [Thermococcus sp. 21S7]NJE61473.1 class I SAM-dependent methyltransferase [Thermococcus sp. 21S7]